MRFLSRFLLIALSTLSATYLPPAFAKPHIDEASAVRLDWARLDAIKPALDAEVAAEIRAGFVAGVATRDGETYMTAAGMADRENAVPMSISTRFRIASMTKPIITAAVMQLVDRGVIALSDPVSRYVPAYADARVATSYELDGNGVIPTRKPSRAITIHDLLTHTAGIGYLFDNASALDRLYLDANLFTTEGTLAERIERIARLPLYNDPGKEWRYSYSIDIAAHVIEVATGEPLDEYLNKNFFGPLKMRDTEFLFDKTDFERVAVVYAFGADGRMVRAGGHELSRNLNENGFGVLSGGAGLVSSLNDYLRFCMMMLRGGELDGARILSPSTVRLMMSDNLLPGASARIWENASASFGLGGLVVTAPGRALDVSAPGEWGWSGHWDTWFVINPADGIAVVLLAQTDPGPRVPRSRARSLVKSIAYGALRPTLHP